MLSFLYNPTEKVTWSFSRKHLNMVIVILKVTVPTFMQATNTDLKLIWVPDTPLHILLYSHIHEVRDGISQVQMELMDKNKTR